MLWLWTSRAKVRPIGLADAAYAVLVLEAHVGRAPTCRRDLARSRTTAKLRERRCRAAAAAAAALVAVALLGEAPPAAPACSTM